MKRLPRKISLFIALVSVLVLRGEITRAAEEFTITGGAVTISGEVLGQDASTNTGLTGTIGLANFANGDFVITSLDLLPSTGSQNLNFSTSFWALNTTLQSLVINEGTGLGFLVSTSNGNFSEPSFPCQLDGTFSWNGSGTICTFGVDCPDSRNLPDLGLVFGTVSGTLTETGTSKTLSFNLDITLDANASKISGSLSASFTVVVQESGPPIVREIDDVRRTAQATGAAYFGGTAWAADSMRWEAQLNQKWTFDTGVGSHFSHDPQSTKDPSLHAQMEGWTGLDLSPGACGGDWSNIVSLTDLPPPLTSCTCNLSDSVLVFEDLSQGGHNLFQHNVALSPWIDLDRHGFAGLPEKSIQFHAYLNLPLRNYVFVTAVAQTASGLVERSAYYGGSVPFCTSGTGVFSIPLGHLIPPRETQIRVGVGVVNYCRFFTDCTGISNSSPWFDEICLVVDGDPNAPALFASREHRPQDSFPQNGTLRLDAPGRVDPNLIKGNRAPGTATSLGDTLIVEGGLPGTGANTNCEVYLQFAVDFGPQTPQPQGNIWLSSHFPANVWKGQQWYVARIDTAEQGGVPIPGQWMSTYHDFELAFTGNDEDSDPNDLDIAGSSSRLANDLFPEGAAGIFTPGTRVNLFYKARYVDAGGSPTTGVWSVFPDTSGGVCLEMEVMPSSADADSTWNCILYVDHEDRFAQDSIENALGAIVAGSSQNFEGTTWDRWDVNAPSSHQSSFGRPLQSVYGANVSQLFAYKTVLWNTGALFEFNLTEQDANILIPWLSLVEQGLGMTNLYVSGDNIGTSLTNSALAEPGGLILLNQWLGANLVCGTVRDPGCPSGSILDLADCMPIDPVAGHFTGNDGPGTVTLTGNGCPEIHSFDLLEVSGNAFGVPQGNETYNGPTKGIQSYESISNEATGGPDFRTAFDGASVHHRRDALCTSDSQIEDRLSRVLNWFGYGTYQICDNPLVALDDIPFDDPNFPEGVLVSVLRNPTTAKAGALIELSLPFATSLIADIVSIRGRRVARIFEGTAPRGMMRISWEGTADTGAPIASGVYFIVLRGADFSETRKLVVIRTE